MIHNHIFTRIITRITVMGSQNHIKNNLIITCYSQNQHKNHHKFTESPDRAGLHASQTPARVEESTMLPVAPAALAGCAMLHRLAVPPRLATPQRAGPVVPPPAMPRLPVSASYVCVCVCERERDESVEKRRRMKEEGRE
jgi:hypothetical protein